MGRAVGGEAFWSLVGAWCLRVRGWCRSKRKAVLVCWYSWLKGLAAF